MKEYNSDYIAFLPIGITFIILGLNNDSTRAFAAVGIVFLILSVTLGFSGKNDKQTTKNKNIDENKNNNGNEQTNN